MCRRSSDHPIPLYRLTADSVGATTGARFARAAASQSIMSIRKWITTAAIGCLLTPAPASALDPTVRLTQYRHTAWRVQDGSFASAPNAIAQTADGYIWIGTGAGLVRYDGVRFTPWIRPGETRAVQRGRLLALELVGWDALDRHRSAVVQPQGQQGRGTRRAAGSTRSSRIASTASGWRGRGRRIRTGACARRLARNRDASAATIDCACPMR